TSSTSSSSTTTTSSDTSYSTSSRQSFSTTFSPSSSLTTSTVLTSLSSSSSISTLDFLSTPSVEGCYVTADCQNTLNGGFCNTLDRQSALSVPLNMLVLIPINIACDIFDGIYGSYETTFTIVINEIAGNTPNPPFPFLFSQISRLLFYDKPINKPSRKTCGSKRIRSRFNFPRFVRQADSSDLETEEFKNFQELEKYCGNTNQTNFNISRCYNRFLVEYTLNFNETNMTSLAESEIRKFSSKFIDNLNENINNNLVFFKLNSTNKISNETQVVYIEISEKSTICSNVTDCDNQTLTALIKNKKGELKQEFIENSNAPSQITATDQLICNFEENDCSFENRKCSIRFNQRACECHNGFYELNKNSDCIKCTKSCLNNGICALKNFVEYCYCTSYFFGDICQINGLVILAVGIILIVLSFLTSIILWICFVYRNKKKSKITDIKNTNNQKYETDIKKVESSEEFDKDKFFETLSPNDDMQVFDAEWDKFTTDDDINWDIIFGKNADLDSLENAEDLGAINPAFLTRTSNLMIPRAKLNGNKDLFGTDISSTLKSQISLPGPTDWSDFKGIPRAWLPIHSPSDNYESDHGDAYF
ncbi:unnamed protein product, partial [Brachionus calyciflorus]